MLTESRAQEHLRCPCYHAQSQLPTFSKSLSFLLITEPDTIPPCYNANIYKGLHALFSGLWPQRSRILHSLYKRGLRSPFPPTSLQDRSLLAGRAAGGTHNFSSTVCQEHLDERPKQRVALAPVERQLHISPLLP